MNSKFYKLLLKVLIASESHKRHSIVTYHTNPERLLIPYGVTMCILCGYFVNVRLSIHFFISKGKNRIAVTTVHSRTRLHNFLEKVQLQIKAIVTIPFVIRAYFLRKDRLCCSQLTERRHATNANTHTVAYIIYFTKGKAHM